MYRDENDYDTSTTDKTTGIEQKPEPSGWSQIPTTKFDTIRSDAEKQDAEQKVFSEPGSIPATQETGGPDKPTA